MSEPVVSEETPRFYSKEDLWIVLLVRGIWLAMLLYGIVLCFLDRWVMGLLTAVLGTALGVLVRLFSKPVYYELGAECLLVRSGMVCWQIRYAQIKEVVAARSWLSAPALSMDRLRIRFTRHGKEQCLYISPENKEEFLRRWQEIESNL